MCINLDPHVHSKEDLARYIKATICKWPDTIVDVYCDGVYDFYYYTGIDKFGMSHIVVCHDGNPMDIKLTEVEYNAIIGETS